MGLCPIEREKHRSEDAKQRKRNKGFHGDLLGVKRPGSTGGYFVSGRNGTLRAANRVVAAHTFY